MNKKFLLSLWGLLLALCAGLGFIREPDGVVAWLLTMLAVASFVPPLLLVYRGKKRGDRGTLRLIRGLSAASLALTLVLLIANFLSVAASQTVGDILYGMLVVAATPMVCSQIWVLSLFLWAYLMISCHSALKKK